MPKHSIEKSCRYHKLIGNSRNKKECVFLCNREFLEISCCIKMDHPDILRIAHFFYIYSHFYFI